MVEHLLSQGPYSLLRRLNLLGRTDVFDRASAHILHRAGLAVWDKQTGRVDVTEYGLTMRRTVRLAPWPRWG